MHTAAKFDFLSINLKRSEGGRRPTSEASLNFGNCLPLFWSQNLKIWIEIIVLTDTEIEFLNNNWTFAPVCSGAGAIVCDLWYIKNGWIA